MKQCKPKSAGTSLFRRFAVVFLISYFIFGCCFHRVRIMSRSMEPTLMTGSTAFFNGIKPLLTIGRGDIVEFKKDGHILGKRIIGLPEDKVSIKEGNVYINGHLLDEPYLKGLLTETKNDYDCIYNVPKGHYLVLGDNRGDSVDSRYWADPYVSRSQIIGTYMFTLPEILG